MGKTSKNLCAVAKDNPWELFTIEELASIIGVGLDVIKCCKRNGAHFVFDMSRPEWIIEFLKQDVCQGIQVKTTIARLPTVVQKSGAA